MRVGPQRRDPLDVEQQHAWEVAGDESAQEGVLGLRRGDAGLVDADRQPRKNTLLTPKGEGCGGEATGRSYAEQFLCL